MDLRYGLSKKKKNGNEKWKLSIRSIDYFKSTNFWK